MKYLQTLGTILAGTSWLIGPAWSVAQTWTQTAAPSNHWTSVACSADGSTLLAASTLGDGQSPGGDGRLYVSTNAGANWTPTTAPTQHWASAALSADGAKLLCGAQLWYYPEGGVWTSTNSGSDWVASAAPFTNGWPCLGCSADGRIVVAGAPAAGHYEARIFTSTNGGTFWSEDHTFDHASWISAAGCGNGSNWLLADQYGTICVSRDFGQTWSETSAPGIGWVSLATSTDGVKVTAAAENYGYATSIYLSTNSGASWTLSSTPLANWIGVASSAEGSRLVAIAESLPIYVSTDSGATWQPTPSPATSWQAVASSADRRRLVAAVRGGGIYTLQAIPAPVLSTSVSDAGLLLSWTVPSRNCALQQSRTLTPGEWKSLSVTPVLNYRDLQYQVSVPRPDGTMFYRLVSN